MSSATRESLVQVARKLFGRYGFKGVSVRQLCEAASCNQAAISYHFRGKEELYRTCLEEGLMKDIERFDQILTRARSREDVEAKLRLFLTQFTSHMVENADVVRMVMHEVNDPSPGAEDIMEKMSQKIPLLCETFINQAKEDGILSAQVDAKSLNGYLCGQIFTQILFEEKVKKNHGAEWGISNPDAQKFLIDQMMLVMSGGIYV